MFIYSKEQKYPHSTVCLISFTITSISRSFKFPHSFYLRKYGSFFSKAVLSHCDVNKRRERACLSARANLSTERSGIKTPSKKRPRCLMVSNVTKKTTWRKWRTENRCAGKNFVYLETNKYWLQKCDFFLRTSNLVSV